MSAVLGLHRSFLTVDFLLPYVFVRASETMPDVVFLLIAALYVYAGMRMCVCVCALDISRFHKLIYGLSGFYIDVVFESSIRGS